MKDILDLDAFPLDQPESAAYQALCARCRNDLARDGMCNLDGFLRAQPAQDACDLLEPRLVEMAFRHKRLHNIYFDNNVPLPEGHPALKRFETSNRTLCADQLSGTRLVEVYEWQPLRDFLATIMGKSELHTMADPLARVNVMSYGEGEALGWHFDRSEFTTTLLLQPPRSGGVFEYRTDLRAPGKPNHEGVAQLLQGQDTDARALHLAAGTLNVFRGVNTPHRVTPVEGDTPRMIAVFSYFDRPGKVFTPKEQLGFYGRSAAT